MKQNNKKILSELWNNIDMLEVSASPEEKEIIGYLQTHENALINALDDRQTDLFKRYESSLSELNYVSRREAFIKGIKFATAYLLEAMNN